MAPIGGASRSHIEVAGLVVDKGRDLSNEVRRQNGKSSEMKEVFPLSACRSMFVFSLPFYECVFFLPPQRLLHGGRCIHSAIVVDLAAINALFPLIYIRRIIHPMSLIIDVDVLITRYCQHRIASHLLVNFFNIAA